MEGLDCVVLLRLDVTHRCGSFRGAALAIKGRQHGLILRVLVVVTHDEAGNRHVGDGQRAESGQVLAESQPIPSCLRFQDVLSRLERRGRIDLKNLWLLHAYDWIVSELCGHDLLFVGGREESAMDRVESKLIVQNVLFHVLLRFVVVYPKQVPVVVRVQLELLSIMVQISIEVRRHRLRMYIELPSVALIFAFRNNERLAFCVTNVTCVRRLIAGQKVD